MEMGCYESVVNKLQEMEPLSNNCAGRMNLTVEPAVDQLEAAEEKKKLEEAEKKKNNRKEIPERVKKLFAMWKACAGFLPMYDRDIPNSCSPEVFQRLLGFAQLSIDVFNQRQPIKYSVVDLVKASQLSVDGHLVDLRFIAKPADYEDGDEQGARNFKANIYYGVRPTEVTAVAMLST
ncbi:hypothetical protein ABFX02_01G078900 [Erythranthe guttata]